MEPQEPRNNVVGGDVSGCMTLILDSSRGMGLEGSYVHSTEDTL